MHFYLSIALLALPFASTIAVASETLDCKTIEKYDETEEGYFVTVKEKSPARGKYRSTLLRKSVAAFYYQEDLTGKTDSELDALAEGVGFTLVKGRNGAEYNAVNVGFGGGNSATYYYEKGTLNFLPFFSYDGDCTEQGRVQEFPIEKTITDPETRSMTCAFGEGSAFQTATVEYLVSDKGEFYGATGTLTLSGENQIVKGVKITDGRDLVQNIRLDANNVKGPSLRAYASLNGQADDDKKWAVQLSYSFKGDKAKFSTLYYPQIAGGRWSKQTVDIDGDAVSCEGAIDFDKIVYYRVIGQ